MTPELHALLADARRCLRAVQSLCRFLPASKRAAALGEQAGALVERIDRQVPGEVPR